MLRNSLVLLFFVLCLTGLVVSQSPPAQDAKMVVIPAGEFWMGQTHFWLRDALEWTERARLDAQPAHVVFLDAYAIDKYEVTNEDYARFVAATGRVTPWNWGGGKVPSSQEKWP